MNFSKKYGTWALITGASSGIGLAFAERLSAEGVNLIIAARRYGRLKINADNLSAKYKVEVIPVQSDLSDENSVYELIRAAQGKEIGILINNAGVGSTGEFRRSISVHDINMVKLNCLAPTILTHHFIQGMVERGKGAIIFLGSVLSFQPTPLSSLYSATKIFNTSLGNALWWELRKYNIDVLSLNPGSTLTEFDRIAGNRKTAGIRKAEDVVNTAFLALGKKPDVVDGILNKIISVITKFIPRRLLVSITGNLTTKLYRQRDKS